MLCPCEPSKTGVVPCDALSSVKLPSEACNENNSAVPKHSRAAKRQQRLRRAILKTITSKEDMLSQPPPGLTLQSIDNADEYGLADDPIDVVDLARRLQRLEVLLFRVPLPNFCILDNHLTKLLENAHVEADKCYEDGISQAAAPVNCEIFDMSDESMISTTVSCDTECHAISCSMETKLAAIEKDLNLLQFGASEFQSVAARLHERLEQQIEDAANSGFDGAALVTAINENTNSQINAFNEIIESHARRIERLDEVASKQESKTEQCLEMVRDVISVINSKGKVCEDAAPKTSNKHRKR